MRVSYIVATTGRPTLRASLQSIECYPGDELIVIGQMGDVEDPRVRFVPCAPGGDWGHTERNRAMSLATGDVLAHLDDDDVYLPRARALMAAAGEQTPGRPVMFKIMWSNGHTLWKDKAISFGNVGTPMCMMPNVPAKFGKWGAKYGGDHAFLQSSRWKPQEYVWRSEVIVHVRPGQ